MRAAPDRDHRTERAALLHAQAQYLAWLETEAPLALAAPEDRKRFNRLVKAIDELLAALGGFGGGSSERALLLHLLQREDGFRGGLRDHSAALGDLEEQLVVLRHAAQFGGGRGLTADPYTRMWAWCAADSWVARLGQEPSASETGPFWLALYEFQRDSGARSARVPVLRLDTLKAALQLWRVAHGGAAGEKSGEI